MILSSVSLARSEFYSFKLNTAINAKLLQTVKPFSGKPEQEHSTLERQFRGLEPCLAVMKHSLNFNQINSSHIPTPSMCIGRECSFCHHHFQGFPFPVTKSMHYSTNPVGLSV